jgi:predicted O-methyltransferase YrrM
MNLIKQNKLLNEHLAGRHTESEEQTYTNARSQFRGGDEDFLALVQEYGDLAPEKKGLFLKEHGISVHDSALSLAVSPEMGEFLFNLTLSKRPKSILELGSSNGVSTLYFAEALRVGGGGRVIATEMEAAKCEVLRNDVRTLGLADFVDVREGDVFETVNNLEGSFDILFIDIWASSYLDIFKEVEHLLAPGAIVLADNMYTAFGEVQAFRAYLTSKQNISNTTLAFESGVEFAIVM